MATRAWSVRYSGESREMTIERSCECYPDYAERIRAEQDQHPGEFPVMTREVIFDLEETLRVNDGYKHFRPGEVRLSWKSMRKENEDGASRGSGLSRL